MKKCECGRSIDDRSTICGSCAATRREDRPFRSGPDRGRPRALPVNRCAGCGCSIGPVRMRCGECQWAYSRPARLKARAARRAA